jgi:hypothetical protein
VTKPARKPNLPPRSDSVTIITRAQPRNQNISPDRLLLERALIEATGPMHGEALAKITQLTEKRVRQLLQSLRQDGFAANVSGTNDPRWRACCHSAAAKQSKQPERFANGNQPRAPASCLPAMACARPGADDHRLIPSREGNVLKPYRAPVSMVGVGA